MKRTIKEIKWTFKDIHYNHTRPIIKGIWSASPERSFLIAMFFGISLSYLFQGIFYKFVVVIALLISVILFGKLYWQYKHKTLKKEKKRIEEFINAGTEKLLNRSRN